MKSPISTLAEDAELTPTEMSGVAYTTQIRYGLLEAGAFDIVPQTLKDLAEQIRGTGGAAQLEKDYQAFKASLPAKTRSDLEARLYPAGRVYGMCP